MNNSPHAAYHYIAQEFGNNYRHRSKLLEEFDSWTVAASRLPGYAEKSATKELEKLQEKGIRLILATDKDFPEELREIPWPPHGIYIRGTLPKNKYRIAIVGTRRASPSGLQTAALFSSALTDKSIVIISGLAFGIDAAAHKAVVDHTGAGIAVLASGVDTITPRTNEQLGKALLEQGGCIISEYPPGTKPEPRFFIERNRIVAGLSQGILVIEAPERSGTLSTARFAIEQNRDVFVIPGALRDQNFIGSHNLIKQGAQLVTEPKDILESLGISEEKSSPQPLPFLDEIEARIVDVVRSAGSSLTADQIAERCSLGAAVINEHLALLVIEGILTEDARGYHIA